MHVALPAVPEQIQVARRIVRKELAGLGWPPAKIAACEEVAAQLARHAIGVVGVSGYYLGVTKRPGPEDAVVIRVSVTILAAPTDSVPVRVLAPVLTQIRSHALTTVSPYEPAGEPHDEPTGEPHDEPTGGPGDALDEDSRSLAEVLTERCGAQVDIVAQQGSWAASVTLPAEVPCLSVCP